METDKRPLYLWLAVALANIGTCITIVIMEVYSGYHSFAETLGRLMTDQGYQIVLAVSVALSSIPILISRLHVIWKNYLGYGIPMLVALYSLHHYFTCTGKFCNIIDIPIIGGACIFALLYAIGIYFSKWSVNFVLSLVGIESVLLIGAVLFLGYYSYLSSTLATIKASDKIPLVEISLVCGKFPRNSGIMYDCWKTAEKMHPETKVCMSEDKRFYSCQ
ncbi:MAG: hypothetical protein EXS59_01930 [Candidatus Taylorbacteria bacterium]|nr:hypothetical protein [Candidatus Taylorbacteria bacterium]